MIVCRNCQAPVQPGEACGYCGHIDDTCISRDTFLGMADVAREAAATRDVDLTQSIDPG